ncbi:MAG: hypothetical protein NT013_28350 [Planctomycetia bacterium]|nr:hypothetical protein [Planctomycetia bacterium]
MNTEEFNPNNSPSSASGRRKRVLSDAHLRSLIAGVWQTETDADDEAASADSRDVAAQFVAYCKVKTHRGLLQTRDITHSFTNLSGGDSSLPVLLEGLAEEGRSDVLQFERVADDPLTLRLTGEAITRLTPQRVRNVYLVEWTAAEEPGVSHSLEWLPIASPPGDAAPRRSHHARRDEPNISHVPALAADTLQSSACETWADLVATAAPVRRHEPFELLANGWQCSFSPDDGTLKVIKAPATSGPLVAELRYHDRDRMRSVRRVLRDDSRTLAGHPPSAERHQAPLTITFDRPADALTNRFDLTVRPAGRDDLPLLDEHEFSSALIKTHHITLPAETNAAGELLFRVRFDTQRELFANPRTVWLLTIIDDEVQP